MNNNGCECCVCMSKDFQEDRLASRIIGLRLPYSVQKCKTCGVRSLFPKLKNQDVVNLYGDGYFYAEKDRPELNDNKFAPNVSTNYFLETVPLRKIVFEERFALIKKMFGLKLKILDVGSGSGDFVLYGLSQGFDITGVEFSEAAVRRAYEINKIQLTQGDIDAINQSYLFDIVHLNHVFEHFISPVDELRKINKRLTGQGVLIMEIPFQFHIVERLKFLLSDISTPFTKHSIHHAYFYSPRTIKLLLNKCGFQIKKMNLYSDSRYPSKTLKEKFKKLIWRILSYFGVGNYIEIIAAKN